jgi:magnesium-protoporphyrin O-methyltransferase
MADASSYAHRRSQIETYFDRTAADAWAKLTSTAPVGRIRATVRAGRERMRNILLGNLPADMRGLRLLDAGCGTGAFAVEAARRGAQVVAIDLSPTLVALADERAPRDFAHGTIEFRVGDMSDASLGEFDHVVAMDSLIHYDERDVSRVLGDIAGRTRRSIQFTFAPRTPLLMAFWAAGRLFPRNDRAPAIEPIAVASLRRMLPRHEALAAWREASSERVASGFYTSQAMELRRA